MVNLCRWVHLFLKMYIGGGSYLAMLMFRLLSPHVHSFPIAFYRMAEHDIGRGVESEIEKGYAASVLESSSEILNRSTNDMEKIFSDLVINPNKPFDWDSLQGRRITL